MADETKQKELSFAEHLEMCNGCSLCEPEDAYREYKDEEINQLNAKRQ